MPPGHRLATRAELEQGALYQHLELPFNHICRLDHPNAIWGPRDNCDHNRLGTEERELFGHTVICRETLSYADATWTEDPHAAHRAQWRDGVRALCRLELCCRHHYDCVPGRGGGAEALSLCAAAAKKHLLLSLDPSTLRADARVLRPGDTWTQQGSEPCAQVRCTTCQ